MSVALATFKFLIKFFSCLSLLFQYNYSEFDCFFIFQELVLGSLLNW